MQTIPFNFWTIWGCWWQNDKNRHQHLKIVANTFRLQHPSPTSMVRSNEYTLMTNVELECAVPNN